MDYPQFFGSNFSSTDSGNISIQLKQLIDLAQIGRFTGFLKVMLNLLENLQNSNLNSEVIKAYSVEIREAVHRLVLPDNRFSESIDLVTVLNFLNKSIRIISKPYLKIEFLLIKLKLINKFYSNSEKIQAAICKDLVYTYLEEKAKFQDKDIRLENLKRAYFYGQWAKFLDQEVIECYLAASEALALEISQDDPQEAIKLYYDSIELIEKQGALKDKRLPVFCYRGLASVYGNLARKAHGLSLPIIYYEHSLTYWNKAIDFAQINNILKSQLPSMLHMKGKILMEMGDVYYTRYNADQQSYFSSAEASYLAAYKYLHDESQKIPLLTWQLTNLYLAVKNYSNAKKYLNETIDYCNEYIKEQKFVIPPVEGDLSFDGKLKLARHLIDIIKTEPGEVTKMNPKKYNDGASKNFRIHQGEKAYAINKFTAEEGELFPDPQEKDEEGTDLATMTY